MNTHYPVLIQEFLSFFADKKIRYFVDTTLGGAGHALALLQAHPEIEIFFGIDQDREALSLAAERLAPFQERLRLIHRDFRHLRDLLGPEVVAQDKIDGIFADLGISRIQLENKERGFSFMHDGPLDMRKDTQQPLTAEIIVNTYPEKELADIFWQYGEEKRSRRAARAIVEARKKAPIKTVYQLTEVLKRALTWAGRSSRKIHPHTQVFQALRIVVNDELHGLQEMLPQAVQLLAQGGRLGIIAFHSLEDRPVKQYFRECALKKEGRLLTKKPITPSLAEITANPPSRSAKLRLLEKL